MLVIMFLIGIGLVAVSGRLVARAIVIPRLQLKSHLREIRDYGFASASEEGRQPLVTRLRRSLQRGAQGTGGFLVRNVPSLSVLSASELNVAGFYDVDPELVHGYRAFAAVGLPACFIALTLLSGAVSFLTVMLIVLSALAGWIGPSFVIRKRGSSRLDEIDRRLPELIDLLIATIEAGMGFTASLALVADRFNGALGEELKLTMKQQSLGMSIQGALAEMVQRCNTPSIRAFVRTAARGESLGVSIGPVLRELSSDQRRRRRMAAREKMQKAPVKMIFPLIFLIFPALMIVLFYPAFYGLTHSSHGLF